MKLIRNFGLTLILILFFSLCFLGQLKTGFHVYNKDRLEHHLPPIESKWQYIYSGHFISSVCENMESEFLQMALFVFLTMCLYQKGSAESKKPPEELTAREKEAKQKETIYNQQMRQGYQLLWRIYENSLTLVLMLIFVAFFILHLHGKLLLVNEKRILFAQNPLSYKELFLSADFWFESFQNWQSEFFSILLLGLLSIFLRQKDSPQSKKMNDPFWKTGGC